MVVSTYTQDQKNKVRHDSLYYAVKLLTTNRNSACCVDRHYVRNLYDYFMELDDCNDRRETQKIDINYINMWEKFHDSSLGHKRPEDLVVCYLSGPEPQNDFNKLVSLGIHPQNIWAFESDNSTYLQAIKKYNSLPFPQPKIVSGSIEYFFKHTPKKFDIIYIDACGVLVSNQHALKIISTMLKYHRLNSPGIVVTNFALPDISKQLELDEYSKLISQHLIFKNNVPNIDLIDKNLSIEKQMLEFTEIIKSNFEEYYSHFITRVLMDLFSVIVPWQRFVNSHYFKAIIYNKNGKKKSPVDMTQFDKIQNNSIFKYLLFNELTTKNIFTEDKVRSVKSQSFINEMSGLDQYSIDLFNSMRDLAGLKNGEVQLNSEIQIIKDYFDDSKGDIHRFLDLPNSNLFFDLVINQLSYPMHYNTASIKRFKYKAKSTQMFTDIFVLDECRYIYEWLPTIHLIKNAFKDVSWQYTFRFALDGLVKQRLKYNNEYFFQGSVINQSNDLFDSKNLSERLNIK